MSDNINGLKLGQRVGIKYTRLTGSVAGFAIVQDNYGEGFANRVIVSLESGFWSEDHEAFTSLLVVYPDNIIPLPPNTDTGS